MFCVTNVNLIVCRQSFFFFLRYRHACRPYNRRIGYNIRRLWFCVAGETFYIFWKLSVCFDFNWGLHEVEPAEAEDERRRLLSDETGRLERLLDRSRNPMAAAPSINFSDTFCILFILKEISRRKKITISSILVYNWKQTNPHTHSSK